MGEYLIIGVGKTGTSVARYLLRRGGVRVFLYDDDPHSIERFQKEPGVGGRVEVLLNVEDLNKLKVRCVVPSPGVPPRHPVLTKALDSGAEMLSDLVIFEREFNGTIIGITGTNGKTTVAGLTGDIFQRAGAKVFLGGNIGVPLLDALDGKYEVAVLELSSFQLYYSPTFRAHTGVLVNLDIDHLDWHPTVEHYHRSKVEWLHRVRMRRVLNVDDPGVLHYFPSSSSRDFRVSLMRTMESGGWKEENFLYFKNGTRFARVTFSERTLPGFYAVDAALAASVGFLHGIGKEIIEEAIVHFRPAEGRLRIVNRVGAVHIYDDSKATNPHATLHAILAVPRKCVVMIGGLNKSLSFKPLEKALNEHCAGVIFFGKDGRSIMEDLNLTIPSRYIPAMRDAVKEALNLARELQVDLLFSPGCASFDEFSSYLERSRVFREIVEAEISA